MDRNLHKNCLINVLVMLGVALAALLVARGWHSLSGQLAALLTGIGMVISLVSWFQMRLEERERLEQLEYDELNRAKGSGSLFQGRDVEGFPARRAREQFQRWAVPIFTVLLALGEGVLAWVWWRQLADVSVVVPFQNPLGMMSVFGLFFLVLFLIGRFTTALGKLEEGRLLRPSSSFALLGAFALLIAAVAVGVTEFEVPTMDLVVARVMTVGLMLLAVETVINLVFELYRPRVRGHQPRPLYESRLVGVLAHPEDIFSTAAHALDYQFGFKVSETWFYQFFRRALGWLILLQVGVLLLSTCVVFIEPGERGLLERWGRLVEARGELEPGAHLTLPWPVDRVKRFQTEQVQTFIVGSQPETGVAASQAVLWNLAHSREELLLVGSLEQAAQERGDGEEERTPPVSVLTVSFPLHFQVGDLKAWAYNHEDPARLLQQIATREVLGYLASSDISQVMASGRLQGGEVLRAAIQAKADELQLGVVIGYIGLQDIHPPVAVAEAFQNVVGAIQKKEAAILTAQAEAILTNAVADAEAFRIVSEAETFRQRAEVAALAQTALFTNQIPAFRAAPSVYLDRAYLRVLTESAKGARKYVLLTTNTQDVLQFDLEEKVGRDLLDIRLPAVQ